LNQTADEFREGLISDEGGIENLTTLRAGAIRALVNVEVSTHLCASALVRSGGVESSSGRRALLLLLQATDRWIRLAQLLGIERKQRPVLSFAEAVERAKGEPK
jgi:hypothetical protein